MHGLYPGVVTCAMGVRLHQANGDPLRPAGMRILGAADAAAKMLGLAILITCGTERHTTGKHPRGEALDFRSKHWSPDDVLRFHEFMRRYLGPHFTVLYEVPVAADGVTVTTRDHRLDPIVYPSTSATAEHFHIQIRKDLAVWPPEAAGSPTIASV